MARPKAPAWTPVTGLKIETPGSVDAGQYDQAVRDITTSSNTPASRPRLRQQLGVGGSCSLLTFLLYLLKKEYWKDVH